MNNLVGLLRDTGRYDEAEPLYEQAVHVITAALGADHPNTRTVRENYETFKANRAAAGE